MGVEVRIVVVLTRIGGCKSPLLVTSDYSVATSQQEVVEKYIDQLGFFNAEQPPCGDPMVAALNGS
jgi:hypothetical protein